MNRGILASALLALGSVAAVGANSAPILPQPETASVTSVSAPPPRTRARTFVLERGGTATELLQQMGAPEGARVAAREHLEKLRPGVEFRADYLGVEATPFRVRVHRDAVSRIILEEGLDGWTSREEPISYRRSRRAVRFEARPSLWEAGRQAGLTPVQILQIGKIFEYDIDFNTELVAGARVDLVVESLTNAQGESVPGEIEAARVANGDQRLVALRWRGHDGESGWFAPEGHTRRRSFLRSPLEFSLVTSGFSTSRFHPILNVARPHWGVDLGAPEGTPIRAVADGVVTRAGPAGGHGNYVELDHGAPYVTSYSHLSVVRVAVGESIKQGELIGDVGQTGLATGPHLHYQFMVDGAYVDPMTVDLPQTGEITEEELVDYLPVRDELMKMLDPDWAPTTARADAGLPSTPG